MRASITIVCLLMASVVVGSLGADVDEALPVPSLYAQQTALFEEVLGEDVEEELVELPPPDLNADNGTPIQVAAASVHEEVYRFVQYEFSVAQSRCSNSTGTETFQVTDTKTNVAQGINYAVTFNYGGASYEMKVLRDPIGNPKELPGEQEVVRDEFTVVSIEPPVCSGLPSWTATQYPQFQGLSTAEFVKKYTGDKAPAATDFVQADTSVSDTDADQMPVGFDWRDHMGDSQGLKVTEQGECAACYATAAASVMSDRLFLASKGRINVDISAQSLMDCSNGCDGGTASDAFKSMLAHKAPPTWCDAYKGVAGTCGNHCSNATEYGIAPQSDGLATLGIQGRGKESAIMYQVYHYGPVYMRMMVYSDFPYYRSGVYRHQPTAKVRGDHAVKLVGWGQEGAVPYWVAQNSWGEKWGEKGFFRIARGEDESGVESRGVFWAIPDVADVCPGAATCNNGGSFTADCGCQCTDGYSGETCDVCGATCEGEGFTGALEADKCACECAPGYFDGEIDGVFTKCGLKIGGAAGVEQHAISVPPCADSEEACPNWAHQGYCESGSKYYDYTAVHCERSCELCDTKKSAQIPVMVEGHLAYQYGDMIVAVPTGKAPWNIHRGWADNSFFSFVCGPETSYEESLYCEDRNPVEVKIPVAGAYDTYFFKFLGKNILGQSRGWSAHPKKLALGACAGEEADCIFPDEPPKEPAALSDQQKAEVAQRVADASLTAAQKAKNDLEAERAKFRKQEAEAHNKILKAAKLAHQAEVKKEDAEIKAKAAERGAEHKELAQKTLDATTKDQAKAKEIDAKRAAEGERSETADKKRHAVVEAITHHKNVLDKLGEISAQLASEQAHVDATSAMASKEKDYKVSKAQSQQATTEAHGVMKAAMRKAAKLAAAAAEAQDMVKKDTVAEKVAKQNQLKAEQESKAADKAFEINQKYKNKHAATTLVHQQWQAKAVEAEKNVTTAKEVAVAAMEEAQCIIKDHRSGCKTDAWKSHCNTEKWKAWMMTHCTESCGFSCVDLHKLAMGVVLKAEQELRDKEKKARKEACPKFMDITTKYAAYADKYGKMATQYEQPCTMRHEEEACTQMTKFAGMSKDFEKKHEKFKEKMQQLKCYEYHGQWGTGSAAGMGSAAGQHLLRMAEDSKPSSDASRLFELSSGPHGPGAH